MTKNERREFDKARTLAAAGHTDMAIRTITILYRSTRTKATQIQCSAVLAELGLLNQIRYVYGCMVHIDDVFALTGTPAVRS